MSEYHSRDYFSRRDYSSRDKKASSSSSSSRYKRAERSPRRSRTPSTSGEWHPYVHDEYNPIVAGSIDGTDSAPHDKAIIRALTCDYRPNKGAAGVKRRSIFIGRLSLDTQESDIEIVMERYGEVVKCKLVRDIVTGFSKRYAFVEFASSSQAKRVLEGKDRIEINGTEVVIEAVHSGQLSGWKPRRLGGGLGGWKESGQLRFGGRARPFRKPLIITGDRCSKQQRSSFTYARKDEYRE